MGWWTNFEQPIKNHLGFFVDQWIWICSGASRVEIFYATFATEVSEASGKEKNLAKEIYKNFSKNNLLAEVCYGSLLVNILFYSCLGDFQKQVIRKKLARNWQDFFNDHLLSKQRQKPSSWDTLSYLCLEDFQKQVAKKKLARNWQDFFNNQLFSKRGQSNPNNLKQKHNLEDFQVDFISDCKQETYLWKMMDTMYRMQNPTLLWPCFQLKPRCTVRK